MVVRQRDVAQLAGVSPRTVSNVVRGFRYVSPEVLARVQAAIDELGYRPNLAARQLREGRTGVVALAVPDLRTPYFGELSGHVLDAAEACGLSLLVEHTHGESEREVALATGRQGQRIDGLILSPLAATVEDLLPGAATTPLVLLGEHIDDRRFDHVQIDNVAAARVATLHLARGGRHRVAFIGVQATQPSRMVDLRLAGYRQAVKIAGLARDPVLQVSTPHFFRTDGYDAVKRLLAAGGRPDAILCVNDPLAHGALRALGEAGLRVPEDVAVAGIDDNDESPYSTPSLTSIAPDKKAIARRAMHLLVSRIEGNDPGDGESQPPGFSLAIRESAP